MLCARRFVSCVLLPALFLLMDLQQVHAAQARMGLKLNRNPIRRVVTMLQSMEKKITEEKKRGQKMHSQYSCYCKVNREDLAKRIPENTERVAMLQAQIDEGVAYHERLEREINDAKESLEETKTAIKEARTLRVKEASEYIRSSREFKSNIRAMEQALKVLRDGQGASFLQTFLKSPMAAKLQDLSIDMVMPNAERDVLSRFLQTGQTDQDGEQVMSPASSEVIGVLEAMLTTAQKDFVEAERKEANAKRMYNSMMAAKNKQQMALSEAIMTKTENKGEQAIKNVDNKADLKDTSKQLLSDQALSRHLKEDCVKKDREWQESLDVITQELKAITSAIELLNNDDALDLFKKALPSASFLQVQVRAMDLRREAKRMLKGKKSVRLDLLSLAMTNKKVNFLNIIAMVDDMKRLLTTEQQDDDDKKQRCEELYARSEENLAEKKQLAETNKKNVNERIEALEAKKEEIADTVKEFEALDKQVQESQRLRKEANTLYQEKLNADISAKDLLRKAKEKLVYVYGTSFFQGSSTMYGEDFAPPKAADVYKKKTQLGSGVIGLIDMMIADLDKDIKHSEEVEDADQAEYEDFLDEATLKRSDYSTSLMHLEDAKSEMEAHLHELAKEAKSIKAETTRLKEYFTDVKADCNFIMNTYEERKEARAGEVESLNKAKAVLSGADYA